MAIVDPSQELLKILNGLNELIIKNSWKDIDSISKCIKKAFLYKVFFESPQITYQIFFKLMETFQLECDVYARQLCAQLFKEQNKGEILIMTDRLSKTPHVKTHKYLELLNDNELVDYLNQVVQNLKIIEFFKEDIIAAIIVAVEDRKKISPKFQFSTDSLEKQYIEIIGKGNKVSIKSQNLLKNNPKLTKLLLNWCGENNLKINKKQGICKKDNVETYSGCILI